MIEPAQHTDWHKAHAHATTVSASVISFEILIIAEHFGLRGFCYSLLAEYTTAAIGLLHTTPEPGSKEVGAMFTCTHMFCHIMTHIMCHSMYSCEQNDESLK